MSVVRRSRPLALATVVLPVLAVAAVTAAPGYRASEVPLPGPSQGGVVRAGDVLFVGQGSYGAGLQEVVRLQAGVATTVARGFNSLGGFDYDAAADVLWVVDNGGDQAGAVTGDTVYAIPQASTRTAAAEAASVEAAPAGSIAFAADVVVLAGGGVLVSDGAGPGAGRVVRVEGETVTPLVSGLDYAAGLALASDGFFAGNVDGAFAGSIGAYALDGAPRAARASGLSGVYGLALDGDGETLLASGGFASDGTSTLVAIAPDGAISERARGFGFSGDIHHDAGRDETLVLDFGVAAVTVLCRDADEDGVCDADDPCTGGSALERPEIVVRRLGRRSGAEAFAVRGRLSIAAHGMPSLALVAAGLRVRLSGPAGAVLDVTVAPDAWDRGTGQGWRVTPRGRWTWRSRDGVGGIRSVVLQRSASGLRATVRGSGVPLELGPEDLPLAVTMTLDRRGSCAEATLERTCRFDPRRKRTTCREPRRG